MGSHRRDTLELADETFKRLLSHQEGATAENLLAAARVAVALGKESSVVLQLTGACVIDHPEAECLPAVVLVAAFPFLRRIFATNLLSLLLPPS